MVVIVAMIPMPKDCYIIKTSNFYCLDKSNRKIWKHKSKDHPYYLVWDSEKGEIEVFDIKTLEHKAVYYSNGDFKDEAVKNRKLRL